MLLLLLSGPMRWLFHRLGRLASPGVVLSVTVVAVAAQTVRFFALNWAGFRNLEFGAVALLGALLVANGLALLLLGRRVVRRAALREIPVFNGMHRFLPTLLRGQGFTVVETAVNHRERLRGTSKYGVHNRLWRGIRDCFGIRWYLKRAVRSDRLSAETNR